MVHLIPYQFATCYAPPPKNLSLSEAAQEAQHQATPRADQIEVAAEFWSTGQAL